MSKQTFHIPNMACEDCMRTIKSQLRVDPAVQSVDFTLGKKLLTVSSTLERTEVEDLIRAAGYTPQKAEQLQKRGFWSKLL